MTLIKVNLNGKSKKFQYLRNETMPSGKIKKFKCTQCFYILSTKRIQGLLNGDDIQWVVKCQWNKKKVS